MPFSSRTQNRPCSSSSSGHSCHSGSKSLLGLYLWSPSWPHLPFALVDFFFFCLKIKFNCLKHIDKLGMEDSMLFILLLSTKGTKLSGKLVSIKLILNSWSLPNPNFSSLSIYTFIFNVVHWRCPLIHLRAKKYIRDLEPFRYSLLIKELPHMVDYSVGIHSLMLLLKLN